MKGERARQTDGRTDVSAPATRGRHGSIILLSRFRLVRLRGYFMFTQERMTPPHFMCWKSSAIVLPMHLHSSQSQVAYIIFIFDAPDIYLCTSWSLPNQTNFFCDVTGPTTASANHRAPSHSVSSLLKAGREGLGEVLEAYRHKKTNQTKSKWIRED